MKMETKSLRSLFLALTCCAFLGACLAGCSHDVKQDPGTGGKGLSTEEKKAKKGDE